MQEFLYGKLNSETIIKQYTSVESPTLKLYIDNKQNTISGQVLVAPKTLGSLRIKMAGELVGESFNGSKDVEINIPPLVLDKSDTETADIDLSDDNTHLRVNVKRVPSKLIINKSNEKIEYDGSSEVEITLSDDILARVDELDSTVADLANNSATKEQINQLQAAVDSKAPSSDLDIIADNVAVNTVDIEGVKNNTTLIKKENGGFFAGDVSSTSLSSTQPDLIAIGTGANASGSRSIAIGKNAKATGTQTNNGGVAIGTNATTGPGVAIGPSTQSEGGVAIGIYPKAKSRNSVAIGTNANVYDYSDNGIAIGEFAYAGAANASSSKTAAYCISIGSNSEANKTKAIAIGSGAFSGGGANAKAVEAIQLGSGTNTTAKTLQIWEHQLLDGNTGKIPDERLSDNVLKVNAQTLTAEQQAQVKENLGVTSFSIQDLPKFINKLYIDMSTQSSLAGVWAVPIYESGDIIVDWGDGSTTEYSAGTLEISHTYSDTNFSGWVRIYGDWQGTKMGNIALSAPEKLVITDVVLDNNITELKRQTFWGCSNIKSIVLPSNLKTIGPVALYKVYIGNMIIPNSVTTIESSGVYIRDIGRLPSNLSTLNRDLFYSYRHSEIIIPESVSTIADSIFGYSAIETVIFDKKLPNTISQRTFVDMGSLKQIIVPSTYLKSAKTKTNLTEYADKIYPKGGNYSETITIPASSWDSATNTVTIEAVGATTEARNIIEWFTSRDNVQVENTYGLNCTEQGTMSLTFTCETIPSEDIQVSVRYTLTNY